jgi:hypothetical protein
VSSAIFGLVGVALGGLISFVGQYGMARRAEAAVNRTAARLLAMELGRVRAALERRLKGSRISRDPWDAELRTDNWPARLERLAQSMPSEDWKLVAAPLDQIDHIRTTIATFEWEPGLAADPGVRSHLEDARTAIEAAERTLERHAE